MPTVEAYALIASEFWQWRIGWCVRGFNIVVFFATRRCGTGYCVMVTDNPSHGWYELIKMLEEVERDK